MGAAAAPASKSQQQQPQQEEITSSLALPFDRMLSIVGTATSWNTVCRTYKPMSSAKSASSARGTW